MWWWWRWWQGRRWQQMTRRQGRLQLMGFSSTRLTRLRAAPPDNSFEHHVCAGGSSTVPRCSKTAFDCVNAQNILDGYLHNLFATTCTTFDWPPSTFYQRLPRFIVKLGWPRANILVLHKVHILTLTASVHCKSWTAAYEASTGPHEYSSVTVSSYLLLTSLYNIHITHNTHTIHTSCAVHLHGFGVLQT